MLTLQLGFCYFVRLRLYAHGESIMPWYALCMRSCLDPSQPNKMVQIFWHHYYPPHEQFYCEKGRIISPVKYMAERQSAPPTPQHTLSLRQLDFIEPFNHPRKAVLLLLHFSAWWLLVSSLQWIRETDNFSSL